MTGSTKQFMRGRQPYTFKEYYDTLAKNLSRMTARRAPGRPCPWGRSRRHVAALSR